MNTPSTLDTLVQQAAAGVPDAAQSIRERLEPVLTCLVAEVLRGRGGSMPLANAVRDFLHTHCLADSPAIPTTSVARLAHQLCDRLLQRLPETRHAVDTTFATPAARDTQRYGSAR